MEDKREVGEEEEEALKQVSVVVLNVSSVLKFQALFVKSCLSKHKKWI